MKLAVNVNVSSAEMKEVELKFFEYQKSRARAVDRIKDFALSGSSGVNYLRSTTNRNRVENALIKAISKEDDESRWREVVEHTYDRFFHDEPKRRFIEVRYFQGRSKLQTCMNLYISENTYKSWRREILTIAYLWAVDLNLMGDHYD